MGKRILGALTAVIIVALLDIGSLLAIPTTPAFESQTALEAKLYDLNLLTRMWIRGPLEVVGLMMIVIAMLTGVYVRSKKPEGRVRRLTVNTLIGLAVGVAFGFSVLLVSWLTTEAEFAPLLGASLSAAGLILSGGLGGFVIELITILVERRGLKHV